MSISQSRSSIQSHNYLMMRLSEQRIIYEDRISTLTYQGIAFALSIILAAQIIFISFNYIIGAVLTTISIISIIFNIIMNIVEGIYLDRKQFKELHQIFNVHKWISLCFLMVFIPLLIWTVIVM